ncbi:MAG: vitamin K epoxide reductase family protein [Blastocatellia bacterium]
MTNPSFSQRYSAIPHVAAMAAALIGLGDSIYLTAQHLSGRSVRCTVTSGCSAVLSSAYAALGGIPTAAFGVAAYFAAFSLATLAAFGYAWARTALALLVIPMVAMTLWLVSIQAFKLRAFCEYCLLSAAMTLALAGLVAAARRKTEGASRY